VLNTIYSYKPKEPDPPIGSPVPRVYLSLLSLRTSLKQPLTTREKQDCFVDTRNDKV